VEAIIVVTVRRVPGESAVGRGLKDDAIDAVEARPVPFDLVIGRLGNIETTAVKERPVPYEFVVCGVGNQEAHAIIARPDLEESGALRVVMSDAYRKSHDNAVLDRDSCSPIK